MESTVQNYKEELKSLATQSINAIHDLSKRIDSDLSDLESKIARLEESEARMAKLQQNHQEIVKFNVGGKKFATTKACFQ